MTGGFVLSVLLKLLNKESFESGDLDIFVNKKQKLSIQSFLECNNYKETKKFNSRKNTDIMIFLM